MRDDTILGTHQAHVNNEIGVADIGILANVRRFCSIIYHVDANQM